MSQRSYAGFSPVFYGRASWRTRVGIVRAALAVALRTVVTRRGLPELDDRWLADVGLTRAEASAEAKRAPWDLEPPRRPRRRPSPHAVPAGPRVMPWLRGAYRRYRSRQAIADLDQRMLKDIGVSYAEAEFEANKAFWRI